jgi:2-dehydro-3-deoxyphosphooctonate aldolase (KDO 8-P synthase)
MKIIAGPCQHESYKHSLKIAKHCAKICNKYKAIDEYFFKASYDKANRTSIDGKRGQGLVQTLNDFRRMKKAMPKLKTLTDVHEVQQVEKIKEYFDDAVDVLQIPAFLCRQTDLIVAALETGKIVNIKKGQFLAPWDVEGIMSKTCDYENIVWITERGTSFGYNRLVVDFAGLNYMMHNAGARLIFDATHSVQEPSANGGSSGGNREYVPGLARAASALGISDFFMEVHDNPDNAPSDGANMIHLNDFDRILRDIIDCHYQ